MQFRKYIRFFFFFFFTFPNNILFLTTRIVKFKIKKKKSREGKYAIFKYLRSLFKLELGSEKKENLKSFEVEDNILTMPKRERIKINIKKLILHSCALQNNHSYS